jgi:sugar lactone lactonase YvrE
VLASPLAALAVAASFIGPLHSTTTIASAVPASGPAQGDVNPYGVAVVPRSAGRLRRGDVLVSNFNDAANQQGTGSSIVEISPSGAQSVFAVVPPSTSTSTSTSTVGLTTALVALRNGDVIVGSLPAPGGVASAATAGALTVLDARGRVITTVTGPTIDGPWDMTAVDHGARATLFVTTVLNGSVAAGGAVVDRGSVVRIRLAFGPAGRPRVLSDQVIATGFGEHTDPNALVVGPTGVGLGAGGTLYVADANGNRVAAVPDALHRSTVLGAGGSTVAAGGALNDPLGLTIAPGGDIVVANGGDGNVVELTPAGRPVATRTLVADGGGDLFGLAIAPHGSGLYFVNDAGSGPAASSLDLLR